jgi:SAM-dependent methyltransferase
MGALGRLQVIAHPIEIMAIRSIGAGTASIRSSGPWRLFQRAGPLSAPLKSVRYAGRVASSCSGAHKGGTMGHPISQKAIAAHDRQRELPDAAQRALIEGLCAHLRDRGPCLDAGVGTGSIALPLAQAGIPVVGVDHSRAMLGALQAKCSGATPLPLIQADLTHLPFPEGAFGAALAANVFHVIPAWQAAVAELVRVVRPGGRLLVNLGASGLATVEGELIMNRFREFLGEAWSADMDTVGPRNVAEFDACVFALGATMLPPLEIRFRQTSTLDGMITRLEHNVFARPATIADAALRCAASATRVWTRERFGPLNAPRWNERVITYRIYQLP